MAALAKVQVVYSDNILQCTTYLVTGPDGAVLVDPGSGYWHDEVIAGVEHAGSRLADISHALLTHCHVDHARGAHLLGPHGIKLVSSPRTAEILGAAGHQVWYEFPQEVVATEVDLPMADGETLQVAGLEFRVLHTTGHTSGCASYLVETADGLAAFTGDLIGLTGHVGWAGSEGFSVAQSIASVEKLLAAAPAIAYQGHGPVDRPACDWLREALERGRAGEWMIDKQMHPNIPPPH